MASTVSNGNDRSEKWHRPFQMATTTNEREICAGDIELHFQGPPQSNFEEKFGNMKSYPKRDFDHSHKLTLQIIAY